MDEVNKKECGCGEGKCGCGGHMHGHGKHCLVKMILKIVIIILIFWCGFKLGAITGSIRAGEGHGYEMMRGGYNMPNSGGATVPVPAQ
jgi:hypothetical protein